MIQESMALKKSIHDLRMKEIHISVGKMTAVNNQLISTVENTHFTSVMKELKPKYNSRVENISPPILHQKLK